MGKWFSHMEKRFFPLAERFCKLVWAVSRLGKRFRKLVRAFSKLAAGLGYLGKRFRKLENRSHKSMNRKIALAAHRQRAGGTAQWAIIGLVGQSVFVQRDWTIAWQGRWFQIDPSHEALCFPDLSEAGS